MRGQSASTASFGGRVWVVRSAKGGRRLRASVTAAVMTIGMLVALPSTPALAAPTNDLAVNAVSARTEPRAFGGAGVAAGDSISKFKYILNIDDTGTTDQRSPSDGCSPSSSGYPASCKWQSISEPSGWSNIYSQGTQAQLPANLPDGRYLISVVADGFKMDGAHFCVDTGTPDVAGCASPLSGPLTIELQPHPLPDGTLRAQVFVDNAPTNMGYDNSEAPLANFVGHVVDTLGEIQTDVYGNPLCTRYEGETADYTIPDSALDGDMLPIPIPGSGGNCVSDSTGMLAIPHLGPARYAVSATPPDGQTWIQTTTLEGNHDYDVWLMEGDTGYSTIFAQGGEPTPDAIFGFVKPLKNGQPLNGSAAGHIKGTVVGIKTYTPPKGGSFDFWGGNTGTKVGHPIDRPWLSLQDLQAGDEAVWIGRGDANGKFDISGVPDGNYNLSWWDEPQDYNLNMINVTVSGGETVVMGQLPLNGWWTEYSGYVFNDLNRNGKRDSGEAGVPNFTLTIRHRENNLYDRGQNTAVTDDNGFYYFESGYPIGEWTVMEAYADNYYTTGVTYQADNQPTPTTIKGAGVDVSVLPIIGLSGTMDWGVHAYDPTGANGIDPRNGGIVGTVSYDTTRNELDPQFAATEDWQPGISGVPVELWSPVDCGTTTAPCDPSESYELAPDGSYARGHLLNTYTTESWERPTGCTARDVNGNPLAHGADEDVLVKTQETTGECISSFMQGIQFGTYPTDQGTPDANFGASVNGNYGFGDGCFLADGRPGDFNDGTGKCDAGALEPLSAGEYLVRVVPPNDALGNPMYKATSEEDINIGNGDQIIPQVPPPACAGALHTVDVAGIAPDGPDAVDNPTFVEIGGSPYEGTQRPRCDTKLVGLNNGKSVAPIFNFFTDVPVPARFRTVIIDDINFSNDKRSIMYGEKVGLPFVPVGLYDYNNKLQYTTETDFNGIYDVLMPANNFISCPTPSGICANMYRVVANDPGIPGRLNPNYNPKYATHAAGAEGLAGLSTFADLAPTPIGVTVETPQTGITSVTCPLGGGTPQLFAVSDPYVNGSGSFTIQGTGFGATKGSGTVKLDNIVLPTTGWNDTTIAVTVPAGTPVGAHQLTVTGNNGNTTVNGLTFHVRGGSYTPTLRLVGPGRTYATVQDALDAAFASSADDLVIVYPNAATPSNPRLNPRGAYYENLIMASPVKLQGVGPGGFQGSTFVQGSIIDASAFNGDTDLATAWFNKIGAMTWDGNQTVNDGAGIYVIASQNATTQAGRARQFTSGYKASIDGFDLRGGVENGFPGNVNDLTGSQTGLPPTIQTQGGAIFANAYARSLQITNNVVQNNGAGYGTIRIGTPDLPAPDTNQHNENVRIANNRVIANAGTNLAGGIGLFAGSDNYEVADNDICGNFSLEYGGGLSVYGRSPNGKIHHNRVYLNQSVDEGGGIMIAGELPTTPGALSPGTGPVDIYANQIQSNLGNDDGGGIRFLMAGNSPINVYNNMIVNNVSTHEGGGIGINDTPDLRIYNNTIMKNLTTATAVTSNGQPAPAGLSTSANSDQLQATIPGNPTFSEPLLFNNIFWDNRAGTRAGTSVTGIGVAGDASPVNHWDVGVADGTGVLAPTNSVIQQAAAVHPYTTSGSNSSSDPGVVSTYDVSASFSTWRQNPAFVDATLVTVEAPPNQMGNYHLAAGSPAIELGAASKAGIDAPADDIDGEVRPNAGGLIDSGADEFGSAPPPPPPPPAPDADFYFSTFGAVPPGVGSPADAADIYRWDGSTYTQEVNARGGTSLGLPILTNVDGFARVDATHFYMSFSNYGTSLPGLGTVRDEDVVYYDGDTDSWTMFFDGSANGISSSIDLGAISIVGNTLYFSTNNNGVPPGAGGTGDNADVYRWDGGSSYTRVVDATESPYGLPNSGSSTGSNNPNVDGLIWVDETHFYMSFSNNNTNVPGLADPVQNEDVVYFDNGSWSVWFDGTSHGLSGPVVFGIDFGNVDAISLADRASPPAPPEPPAPQAFALLFSTLGGLAPPGIVGNGDDANVYGWDGTAFARVVDGRGPNSLGLARSADIDGVAQVDAAHFYLSFKSATAIPGLGNVADEDVVYYDNGTWSMFFDGSTHGITSSIDLGAISVVGDQLYFSTNNSAVPPGAGGTGDNADIYHWNGDSSYTRVVDATAAPYNLPNRGWLRGPNNPDVDGLVWVDENHFYLSFSNSNTNIPGVGRVQDEDVVYFDNGTWSVFFDGTANGLTAGSQDVDGFYVP